jgi:hypothetical protein
VAVIPVVFPFGTTAPLDAKIATAVVNLAIGIAVGRCFRVVSRGDLPGGHPVAARS